MFQRPLLCFIWIPPFFLCLMILRVSLPVRLLLFPQSAPQVSSLWLFFFASSTLLVLVPAPLLEPRYFIIPYVITLLHVRLPRTHRLATALCIVSAYVLVNATAMYLFLFRPFKWEGHEGWQRFMW